VNIAALRRLPVVFLCENNSLEALGQRANEYPSSTLAASRLTDLVHPFGVPAVAIDGTDTGAVHSAMSDALARARASGGPSFIEARTVRWPGNRPLWPQLVTGATQVAFAWDETAIAGEHATWWRGQDGLIRFVRELVAAGHVSPATCQSIDAEAIAEMDDAVRFALASPYPEAHEALADVYA
jgi:pyruvate dehydrogenase E1 component alpha subunit